jgi:hypothetical protein
MEIAWENVPAMWELEMTRLMVSEHFDFSLKESTILTRALVPRNCR